MTPRSLPMAILLFAAPRLLSQTFELLPTVDSLVAQADQVVVGRIVAIRPVVNDPSHDRRPILLTVSDTLKGTHQSQLHVDLLTDSSRHPQDWQIDAHRLLVAVMPREPKDTRPPIATIIDLDAPKLAEWRADFVLLTRADDILKAARDEVARIPPGVTHIAVVGIDKSDGFTPGTSLDGSMTRGLYVPADSRMEARARAILAGKIKPFYGSDSEMIAVQDLGYIKSDENIRFLTEVLHGPDQRLRYTAQDSLKRLGIKVPDPN